MKVAIIVPTYNNAATLAETLESLQNQAGDLSALTQVYLTDDGSSDDTLDIARACWRSTIPLTIHVNEKNLGERGNVNNAVAHLSPENDWVLLLHSDDIAKPDWFAKMTERMRLCGPDIGSICSSYDCLYPDGSTYPGEDDFSRPFEIFAGNDEFVRKTLNMGCWWHVSGCGLRTAGFAKIGGFRLHMPQCGDWEWSLRCLRLGWGIEYIPRTLIYYRQHWGSVSAKSFQIDRDLREKFEVIGEYAPFVSKTELCKLHLTWMYQAIRRLVKALLGVRLARAGRALQTLGLAGRSFLATLNKAGRAAVSQA